MSKIVRANKPVINLHGDPQKPNILGQHNSQLLYGEAFEVQNEAKGFYFGQCQHDGYEGYISVSDCKQSENTPTHIVSVRSAPVIREPTYKYRAHAYLPFGACLNGRADAKKQDGYVFIENLGWLFESHFRLKSQSSGNDLCQTAADLFLGTPYLFGGRSPAGVDCSGLVQMSMIACGHPCPPRDTKKQKAAFGKSVAREDVRRNDIVYFDGHVGIMADETNILNATARHMTTLYEKLEDLAAVYDGITHIARLV